MRFLYVFLAILLLSLPVKAGVLVGGVVYPTGPVYVQNFLQATPDARLTTSASTNTAWYWNSTGTLTQSAVNTARYDYDPKTKSIRGLLVEGSTTNLFLNNSSPVTQSITTSAQKYTLSFYGNGTIVMSGTCSGTLTGVDATTLIQLTITATAGTCTTTVSGTVIYPQFEAFPFATSRLVTSGSPVTRRSNELTSDTNISGWIRTQGTVYVELILEGYVSNSSAAFAFDDNTYNNDVDLRPYDYGGFSEYVVNGGASILAQSLTPPTPYVVSKFEMSFSSAGLAIVRDGKFGAVHGATTIPSGLSVLRFGYLKTTSSPLCGWVRVLKYYNYVRTPAQMVEDTK